MKPFGPLFFGPTRLVGVKRVVAPPADPVPSIFWWFGDTFKICSFWSRRDFIHEGFVVLPVVSELSFGYAKLAFDSSVSLRTNVPSYLTLPYRGRATHPTPRRQKQQ